MLNLKMKLSKRLLNNNFKWNKTRTVRALRVVPSIQVAIAKKATHQKKVVRLTVILIATASLAYTN